MSRPLPLAVSALVFTALLIGLPLAHLGLRPGGLTLFLLALPPLVLAIALVFPRRPALTHFAFPIAHLPSLLALPELAGARIYAGATGFVAFLAVVGAGGAYLVAATPRLSASHARIEPLVGVALVLAFAPLIALLVPALGAASAPWGALTALALAPLIAWWLVAHGLAQQVALPALDPSTRIRTFYALRERVRPRTTTFVLAALASVIALGLLAFWYLWRPR